MKDPEIPVLSIMQMGMITGIEVNEEGAVHIRMTPTFAGCPAIDLMKKEIKTEVERLPEVKSVEVQVDFKEQWTSNRISEEGREAIRKFGLAPPEKYEGEPDLSKLHEAHCPYCNSTNTTMNSPFGPTLCRSIHFCYDCRETFEQFKPV